MEPLVTGSLVGFLILSGPAGFTSAWIQAIITVKDYVGGDRYFGGGFCLATGE
ncbi:MAG: hypothetical protein LBV21_03505 [Candidatus Adiutrix sp.]|nr:hypothetical protein [Candidatus Adiutrix sp.]